MARKQSQEARVSSLAALLLHVVWGFRYCRGDVEPGGRRAARKPTVVTRGRNLLLYPSRSWKQLRRPGRQVLSGGTPSSQAVPAFREECVQEGQRCPDGTADGLLGSDSDSPTKGEKGSSFPRRRVAELFRRRLCGAVCTRSHAVGAGSPGHLPALAALSLERLPFSRRGSWSSRGLAFPEPHCSVRGRGGM